MIGGDPTERWFKIPNFFLKKITQYGFTTQRNIISQQHNIDHDTTLITTPHTIDHNTITVFFHNATQYCFTTTHCNIDHNTLLTTRQYCFTAQHNIISQQHNTTHYWSQHNISSQHTIDHNTTHYWSQHNISSQHNIVSQHNVISQHNTILFHSTILFHNQTQYCFTTTQQWSQCNIDHNTTLITTQHNVVTAHGATTALGKPWCNMKMSLTPSCPPSTTSSEAFFIQTHLADSRTCWQSGRLKKAHRNWEEPALELLASKQEPAGISSLDNLHSLIHTCNQSHTRLTESYLSVRQAEGDKHK